MFDSQNSKYIDRFVDGATADTTRQFTTAEAVVHSVVVTFEYNKQEALESILSEYENLTVTDGTHELIPDLNVSEDDDAELLVREITGDELEAKRKRARESRQNRTYRCPDCRHVYDSLDDTKRSYNYRHGEKIVYKCTQKPGLLPLKCGGEVHAKFRK